MTTPVFDPLAILERVKQMSDAEIKRSNDEWRAVYGDLDPFAVLPFVERKGAPVSAEGHRLACLLQRAKHGRLPITQDIRSEFYDFLGAIVDGDRYAMTQLRQNRVNRPWPPSVGQR